MGLVHSPPWIQLLRPRQWLKNAFVLAPLLFAGRFLDPGAVAPALGAALLFCLAASAVYVANDLRDRERDRGHPTKARTRPLAAGTVTPRQAVGLLILLLAALAAGGVLLPEPMPVIAAYLALNLLYTFHLKEQPVVDIFVVAIGFVLRVYAGALAIAVPVSGWMFVTTLCLALYLAAVKRRQELLHAGSGARAVLERYTPALVERYAEMSATGALLFYSLYVVTAQPALVITVPLVLFGLFRYWYVVEVEGGGEAPTDVLLSDRPLQLAVAVWVAACAWVILKGG